MAVVQVALRAYAEGNFWSNFFKEVRFDRNVQLQCLIGAAFTKILKEQKKYYAGDSSYVNNILLHCYVTDYYLDDYFLFLYKFYTIDLERDIDRLDRDTLNNLIASICAQGTIGRTYMLVRHTADAVCVNTRGAKIRIRNHVKLMDKLFWDSEQEITSGHRIYSALYRWSRSDTELKRDADDALHGRAKGSRHFSSPYLYFNQAKDVLRLELPAQSICRGEDTRIFWHISGGVNEDLPVELKESVIGYKVLESSIAIPLDTVLSRFVITLQYAAGKGIRRFTIDSADIRFFDDVGYADNSGRIKTGKMFAFTAAGKSAKSPALYESRRIGSVELSFYDFSFQDILCLPNGKAIIVGQREIVNGLFGRELVENATCFIGERSYPLYAAMPTCVLRMKEEKMPGTLVELNGVRHKLSELAPTRFVIDDISQEVGFFFDIPKHSQDADGAYTLLVDIPDSIRREWEFVVICGFQAVFDGEPYIFQPRGVVTLPDSLPLTPTQDGCVRYGEGNTYRLDIEQLGRSVGFTMPLGNTSCTLQIPIPAVFIDIGGCWTSQRPEVIWHKELPDSLDISVPYHKLTLSVSAAVSDEKDGDTDRSFTYKHKQEETVFHCDIRRFKSYLSGDSGQKTLYAAFGGESFALLQILTRSILVAASMVGDFQNNSISISTGIIGKGSYSFDIYKDAALVAEKQQFNGSTAAVPFDGSRGVYRLVVYEEESDDAGFGLTDYVSIGEITQELIDPYDMNGRALKVVQVLGVAEGKKNLHLRYEYSIRELTRIGQEAAAYSGTMVVFLKGAPKAAFPVVVVFPDILSPDKAELLLVDEYGERAPFLYDTKHAALVQEETPNLPRMECYRIYTYLDSSEYLYRIAFDTPVAVDTEVLPALLEIFEPSDIISRAIRRHKQDYHPIHILDITWTRNSYLALKDLGLYTINELSDLTVSELMRITNVSAGDVISIRQTLRNYQLDLREE